SSLISNFKGVDESLTAQLSSLNQASGLRFQPFRPVPACYRSQIERSSARFERAGVVEPVRRTRVSAGGKIPGQGGVLDPQGACRLVHAGRSLSGRTALRAPFALRDFRYGEPDCREGHPDQGRVGEPAHQGPRRCPGTGRLQRDVADRKPAPELVQARGSRPSRLCEGDWPGRHGRRSARPEWVALRLPSEADIRRRQLNRGGTGWRGDQTMTKIILGAL